MSKTIVHVSCQVCKLDTPIMVVNGEPTVTNCECGNHFFAKKSKRKVYRKKKMRLLQFYRKCWLCNKALTAETATVDHVIPLSKGGMNNYANLRLACQECNNERIT